MAEHWVRACATADVEREDVLPFEHEGRTYAIYCSPAGEFFASDGRCTHENTLLSGGMVFDHIIECPKHKGRFDYRTGQAKGAPVIIDLRTYPVRVEDDSVFIGIS